MCWIYWLINTDIRQINTDHGLTQMLYKYYGEYFGSEYNN
jgi:hypothetical protein